MNKSYNVIDLSSTASSTSPIKIGGGNSYLIVGNNNQNCQIELGDRENVEIVDTSLSCNITLTMGCDSTLSVICAKTFEGKSNYTVDLNGKGGECNMRGITVASKSDKIEVYTTVKHHVTHCNSSQLFKAVGAGSSTSLFEGLIYVATGAVNTISLQENKNILLSEKAQIISRPWLEIYADDVKCSHGSSTGKLSDEEIFYMQQRGISEEVARELQLEGFALEIVEAIKDNQLRQILEAQLLEAIQNV